MKNLGNFYEWLEHVFESGVRWVKSSILSLIVLAIFYFLLTKMGQAAAMVVDLVETDWIAFLFSVILVNALAFSLSHFPIYNYYAADLGTVKDAFRWRSERSFFGFRVNTFTLQGSTKKYTYNLGAHIFRYLNGFLVFLAWNYIVIYGFEANLLFECYNVTGLKWLVFLVSALLFFIYRFIKKRQYELKEKKAVLKFRKSELMEKEKELAVEAERFDSEFSKAKESVEEEKLDKEKYLELEKLTHDRADLLKQYRLQLEKEEEMLKAERSSIYARLTKTNIRLTTSWFLVSLVTLALLVRILFLISGNEDSAFSKSGLTQILILNFLFLVLYFNFRLIRPELTKISNYLSERKHWLMKPVYWFTFCFNYFSQSRYYLSLLFGLFVASVAFIIYAHVQTFKENWMINGIPILLAYLYAYSYAISAILKYYFVTRTGLESKYESGFNKKRKLFWRRFWSTIIAAFVILLILDSFLGWETKLHELTKVEQIQEEDMHTSDDLIRTIEDKNDSTIFFVAAQGGGLKANFWTLNVLNYLQKMTGGKFLDRTVVMSGASGGSLGLGLYTALFREHQRDYEAIQKKIDSIVVQNYTSMDLTLMFGYDFFRTIPPFKFGSGTKNRTFYSMVRYQNIITGGTKVELSKKPYRELWNEAYEAGGYFPSLIMNTGSVKGSRGIFWSHWTDTLSRIFPFSENLADLREKKTIPFYQAISTTNRFPLFSPVAKIKGSGHYIDVGAIENSGLLGCWDVYSHLKKNGALEGKRVVFVEIVNGKSKNVRNFLADFEKVDDDRNPNLPYNEKEYSTIAADGAAGLNLDKFPEYLAEFMRNWDQNDENMDYIEIALPHRLLVEDVEGVLDGEIEDCGLRDQMQDSLDCLNTEIWNILNDTTTSCSECFERRNEWEEHWKYFELALSRHLSRSNIYYGTMMFEHPELKERFKKIKALTEL